MPRNGAGLYTLPAGNPVVANDLILDSWANTTLEDIRDALTASVAKNGETAMTGNLPMGNNKITGLGAPSAGTDSARWQDTYGKFTIGVSAGGIFPAITNGAAGPITADSGSEDINYKYLAFDPTTQEFAWFWFPSPKSYNASTFTFRVVWTHPATATNFGVAWSLQLLALANDDAINTALGTEIVVTDTGGTTQDFYITAESAAVTAGNTPAKQDWIAARIARKPADAADTMTVDAHLLGIEVYYTTNASDDS